MSPGLGTGVSREAGLTTAHNRNFAAFLHGLAPHVQHGSCITNHVVMLMYSLRTPYTSWLSVSLAFVTGCALVPGLDTDSDGSGQAAVTHSCYFPRDCAVDGRETCVMTDAGNRCMALSDETYEVEPVAASLERFVKSADEQPQTLGGLIGQLPSAPATASLDSYLHVAQSLLKPLVLRERHALQQVQSFITVGDQHLTRAPSGEFKYEAYRQLYAAKYAQNQELKAALGRLFNFMPEKPLFSHQTDGRMGITALEDCAAIVRAHPLSGNGHALDPKAHACLDLATGLLPLMAQSMSLSQYPLWPIDYAQRIGTEIAMARSVLHSGLSAHTGSAPHPMATLRHRLDAFFPSLQADYVVLVQLLDEALRGLAIVEMPISITPLHPDTPPQPGEDANLTQTFPLGQWANGEWYTIRQALQGMPADAEVPLEPWQRYFEGAFKQAIAQSYAINESLYQKLFYQSGFDTAEAWKLAPLIDALGIVHLPDYAALGLVHQQLLEQIQTQLDDSRRHLWSDLALCALGIVGGAGVGIVIGAPAAGAKVGGAVLCSVGAYHGVQEAQAIAQVLNNLHTFSFFGMQSAYASIIALDDVSERFKWSLFFIGVDVIGASFDVADVARGVPELIEATATSLPKVAARMARSWEQSYARHLLAGGPLQIAPDASEFTPDGELIRLSSNGSSGVVMIRDPLLRGEIRTYITERDLSVAPEYWVDIPLSASVLYQRVWRSNTSLTARTAHEVMTEARSHLGSYSFAMTQAGTYNFPGAFSAANAILRDHHLPNMFDKFDAQLAQGARRAELLVTRVFPDNATSPVFTSSFNATTYEGRYISPKEPAAGWTALADVLNRMRMLARTSPRPSDAAVDLMAEYAYVASGLLPFPRTNWGLFYQVILQAYQIFDLKPRHSAALDHFMWAAADLAEAKLIFRAWYSGQLDRDIHQNAQSLFRY